MNQKFYFCFLLLIFIFLTLSRGALCNPFTKLSSHTAYVAGTEIPIVVNSLTSVKGLIPYDFYSVKACMPDPERFAKDKIKENLGEIILGNRIMPSVYSVVVGKNASPRVICTVGYSLQEMKRLELLISDFYRAHMFLDGLPLLEMPGAKTTTWRPKLGYSLGISSFHDPIDTTLINNYLHFTVTYTFSASGDYLITGFYVTPHSMENCAEAQDNNNSSTADVKKSFATPKSLRVTYCYSVSWERADLDGGFTTRWDVYARAAGYDAKKGHWITIFNSLALLTFFLIFVVIILTRTIRRDLLIYTDLELAEEVQEESGWKLLHGDVFRTPPMAMFFTAFVSTGSQLLLMIVFLVFSAIVGVLHPAQRGNLLTALIVFFCFSSCMSGYVAGRMLKFFRKQSWSNGFTAVTLVPACLLFGYLFVAGIYWAKNASASISFLTFLNIIFLWVFIPIPLSFLGLSRGFKANVLSVPTKISSIPRMVSPKAMRRRCIYILTGGFVPFSAAFIEVVYILGSFWRGEPFHYFGYLICIGLFVALVSAEVAVVVTYIMLSEEDYHWWWCSFLASGSCGLYFLIYSIVYLLSMLEIRQMISVIIFCIYSVGLSAVICIVMGTLGFLASAVFVRVIFGAIKSD